MPDPDVLFWFKKLLTQLVMPLPLLFLLLVILLILINQRSAITKGLANVLANTLVLAMLGIVLLSQAQVSSEIGGGLENKYRANHQPIVGECTVMVLGSGHSLLTGLSATQQLSPTALARLVEGVRQLKLSQQNTENTGICRLVVSGWNGGREGLAHAEVMALAAQELGVSKEQIITFPEARDTIEELLSMKTLIGDAPFRLVTSATHMPRAIRVARSLGLNPEASPSNFLAGGGYWWRLEADNLVLSQASIHEYVGILWLDVKAWWVN